MTHYILTVHMNETYSTDSVQNLQCLGESATHASWQVHLGGIARYYHLGIHAHSCQEHLYLCRSGVLGLIQNNHGIIQCSASHEGQWSNLYYILFHHLTQLLGRYHILQSIIEGLQIRIYLISHITRQKAQFLSCLNSRTRENNLTYLLIFQRAHCQCYTHVCLSATSRTCGKDHIIFLKQTHQFLLVLASGRNGFACNAVHHYAFHTLLTDTLAFQDMQDIFFRQAVVLQAMLLQLLHVLFQGTHFQFIAHDMQHIATCHYAQLGIKGLYHLDIDIVDPIKHYGVHIFQYDVLFYHLLIGFVHKVTQYIWNIRHFIITLSRKS